LETSYLIGYTHTMTAGIDAHYASCRRAYHGFTVQFPSSTWSRDSFEIFYWFENTTRLKYRNAMFFLNS